MTKKISTLLTTFISNKSVSTSLNAVNLAQPVHPYINVSVASQIHISSNKSTGVN